MKVKELIEQLQRWPLDTEVYIKSLDYSGSCCCSGPSETEEPLNGSLTSIRVTCDETDPQAIKNDKGKVRKHYGRPYKLAVLLSEN